ALQLADPGRLYGIWRLPTFAGGLATGTALRAGRRFGRYHHSGSASLAAGRVAHFGCKGDRGGDCHSDLLEDPQQPVCDYWWNGCILADTPLVALLTGVRSGFCRVCRSIATSQARKCAKINMLKTPSQAVTREACTLLNDRFHHYPARIHCHFP